MLGIDSVSKSKVIDGARGAGCTKKHVDTANNDPVTCQRRLDFGGGFKQSTILW